MKFAIITHVEHIHSTNKYFGYAPYIREMNIWFNYVDEVIVVAPLLKEKPTSIDIAYNHPKIDFRKIPNVNFINLKNSLGSIFKLPNIFWRIFWAMRDADHIHLRCPGNIGLLGCLVQIFFPNKPKTAKYAGNWDPESKQPWTYQLQKYILNNTFLTKNMQVLVYGEWKDQSKNIKSFFTATYSESEKIIISKTNLDDTIEFVFAGSLVLGKNPLYAIKLVEQFIKKGKKAILNLYGEGIERSVLERYIQNNDLEDYIFLRGNQSQEIIKTAYQKSHFVILPSKSEGWPKVIAEAMFWGTIPIVTEVSCVSSMLDYGRRGILLKMDLEKDINQINELIVDETSFLIKSKLAIKWSQNYTTDIFEAEIKKLIKK